MSRAEKLLEAAEETLAQSFADGLATRFDQLHLDVDEIEVVVDEETGFVFIEIEQEEKFLSEAVGISQSGGVSQVAVIHRIPKDDDLLVALRDRASELGLDAYIEDEIEDTEIEHIDYPNNIAGSGEWGLYPIETGEEE